MLVDLLVAAVVAVLSVVDVASASAERMPGERPADGLAYALVIAGVGEPRVAATHTDRGAGGRDAVLVAFWLRGHGAFLSVLGLPRSTRWPLTRSIAGGLVGAGVAVVVIVLVASVSVLDTPDGFRLLRPRSAWWPSWSGRSRRA